jgi:hypothetical protein
VSIVLALKGPGACESMASSYQLSQLQKYFLSSCHNRFTRLMIDHASSPGCGYQTWNRVHYFVSQKLDEQKNSFFFLFFSQHKPFSLTFL